MKTFFKKTYLLAILLLALTSLAVSAQNLDEYKYNGSFHPEQNAVVTNFQFNGYTNHWHDIYRKYFRYGNLFKIAIPDVESTIAQNKVDIADELAVPGLTLQEGFMYNLLKGQYTELDQPTLQKLNEASGNSTVIVLTDPDSETGKMLTAKLPKDDSWKEKLKSHQFSAKDYTEVNAFYLENGTKKIYVISSKSKELRNKTLALIANAKDLLAKYDLHKGWFGTETLLNSVTCTPGHPLEVIGKGMNEGNTWFTFSGYMDFLSQKDLITWLGKVKLPVIADVGFGQIYGLKDYDGLQVQSMFTIDSWITYAHEKQGFVFRQVYDTTADPFHYDGYMATEGNKEQIDNEDVPFISTTGPLYDGTENSMVLFIKKGEQISKQLLYEAIMDRREVAVLESGKMMGPALYRNALQLLLLDRIFLEEYYGDRINIDAVTKDYQLSITLNNSYDHPVSGTLDIVLAPELKMAGAMPGKVNLPANSSKTLLFTVNPTAEAMDKTNPIAVHYTWETSKKSTLAILDLPRAISVQQLLYGHTPKVTYPVTIHNFTDKQSFPVKVEVLDKNNPKKTIFTASKTCTTGTGTFRDMSFDLDVAAGNYLVKVTALGVENLSQLGVGAATGKPYLYEVDLSSDGIMEYRMENDSVQVTLLATGARVIEYIVKSKQDNVFFKLWPEKAADDKRLFRKRGYYPYGGFEDFLGQGSMETHKVYDVEVLKKEGDYVRVKMTADYYGNKLEKIFTLYGNSPLLEVQFALTFKNPEANVIGPQPILEIGARHWTEDVFTVPEKDGLHEYRMKPEKYYGRLFFLKEGWNAGYDTQENVSFVGAFPVTEPLFLHMWMNHPSNSEAHYYYTEFQPWIPIYQKSTMYFSYYMWAAKGPWQNGVDELRRRNLVTEQK
jgi:5S rRNA maturation endonuclease (ribonuclease M5)